MASNRAMVRHEITDRALMLVEVWDEHVCDRLRGIGRDRGSVPAALLSKAEAATSAMYAAVNKLSEWEDAAKPQGNGGGRWRRA